MSIQELSPEQLAELFHHYQHALDRDFGRKSEPSAEGWGQVPQTEMSRRVAAARRALQEVGATSRERNDDLTRYFAKPGEAEWGC